MIYTKIKNKHMKKVIPIYEDFLNEARGYQKKLELQIKKEFAGVEITSHTDGLGLNGSLDDFGITPTNARMDGDIGIDLGTDGHMSYTVFDNGKEVDEDTFKDIFDLKDFKAALDDIAANI